MNYEPEAFGISLICLANILVSVLCTDTNSDYGSSHHPDYID